MFEAFCLIHVCIWKSAWELRCQICLLCSSLVPACSWELFGFEGIKTGVQQFTKVEKLCLDVLDMGLGMAGNACCVARTWENRPACLLSRASSHFHGNRWAFVDKRSLIKLGNWWAAVEPLLEWHRADGRLRTSHGTVCSNVVAKNSLPSSSS